MLELDSPDARAWLAGKLGVPPISLEIRSLGGGVSNHVLLAESGSSRCVVKQSLERLRVRDEWLSRRERIFRECAALRAVAPVLPRGAVPEIIFEDQANYAFAMEAAPADAYPWKSELLTGEVRQELAQGAGLLLGAWIRESAHRPEWKIDFGDLSVFGELRVDPYYRSTAAKHPALQQHFTTLIDECLERRVSLVHGDFSPKNLLVRGSSLIVIDWEVVHWGDPSFDAAFLTNHFLLKAAVLPAAAQALTAASREFWKSLRDAVGGGDAWLEPAAMRHLGCLLLARIDGKSPVEYVRDEALKSKLRVAASQLITNPPANSTEAFERALT